MPQHCGTIRAFFPTAYVRIYFLPFLLLLSTVLFCFISLLLIGYAVILFVWVPILNIPSNVSTSSKSRLKLAFKLNLLTYIIIFEKNRIFYLFIVSLIFCLDNYVFKSAIHLKNGNFNPEYFVY